MLGEEEEEDSDFEVESARGRRRAGSTRAGAGRSASRRSGAARAAGGGVRRRDGRRGSGARRGSVRGVRSGGVRAGSARRDPASLRPSSAFRKVLRGDEEAIKAAGAGIVGARVAVFSHSDEQYHKVGALGRAAAAVRFDTRDGRQLKRTHIFLLYSLLLAAPVLPGHTGSPACKQLLPFRYATVCRTVSLRPARSLTQRPQPHPTPSHTHPRTLQGKLVQFDSYHKRHKVAYDDGDEEWVSLPREAFRWLTPRARSAGCTREYRALMQQLGAEDCGLAALSTVSTRRQTAAGGSAGSAGDAACPPGGACVGWQVRGTRWPAGLELPWQLDARRALWSSPTFAAMHLFR